jgi:hypothetical protein
MPKHKKQVLYKCLIGVLLLACSYIPHHLQSQDYGFWGSLFYGMIYYLGGVYLANAVIVALSGKSLIRTILLSPKNRVSFFKLSLLGAIPFSLAVSTFGGLWYFPHWTATEYYVTSVRHKPAARLAVTTAPSGDDVLCR